MAQQAGMSTEGFEQFYFDVCNLDYQKMSNAMDPLLEPDEKKQTRVHIKRPGTDLSFSIKDIGAVKMRRAYERAGRGSVFCAGEG